MAPPNEPIVNSGDKWNEAPRAQATRTRRAPLIPEQLAAGLGAALLVACVEGALAALGDRGSEASGGDLVTATLHTIAFYLPAGLALGLASAILVATLRASPALAPIRARLSSPVELFAPAPRLTADVLAGLAGVGLVAFVAGEAYALLATIAHRVDLAAWAMTGVVAGAIVVAFLARTALRAVLVRLTPLFGRLASLGAILAALAIAGGIGVTLVLRANPEVLEAYRPLFVLPPIILVAHVLVTAIARSLLRRTSLRRARAFTGVLVAVCVGAWLTSAVTYGRSNVVRTIVEEETLAGRTLLRRYLRITDLDGDRHSWGFGGRDCNDFDPRIHPGTLDEPGDGIDLDCFAGDGAPVIDMHGDGAYGERPAATPARPNFVLITIDALRPDHLGIEGYARDTSPNIDAFARDAVRFRDVLAPSSRSIRSIPAMFTGLYPSQIAYGNEYLYPGLLRENTTLAEVLKENGWQTAVTMGTDYFHRVNGFYQGFDDVEEVMIYKPPRDQTVDRALVQLDRLTASGEPFFQWVHLFHVHAPYLSPPYPSRYGEEHVDKYDTEVGLADAEVQRLLSALEQRGVDERTVVILASDHGEAFREHGHLGHARTLYEEEVRSVMMMRIPGVSGRRVDATVSLIDLTPSVLNLADIPIPHPMPAQSVVPLATGERQADPERWLFGELLPDGMFPYDIKTIRRGDIKLHWWVREGTIQLFDLAADPGERRDLSDERREHADELLGTLQAWVARSSRDQHRNAAFVHEHLLARPPERMTHPLDLHYPGLFTVLGCDIPETEVEPAGTLDVTCYYRVEDEMSADLFMRITLDGPRGYRVPEHMHAMHFPLHGRYRTTEWRAGEILRDPTPIAIPSTARAPVELSLRFAVEQRSPGRPRLLSYQHHGRPGTTAHIANIRLRPRGSDASDDEPPTLDGGVRDAAAPTE